MDGPAGVGHVEERSGQRGQRTVTLAEDARCALRVTRHALVDHDAPIDVAGERGINSGDRVGAFDHCGLRPLGVVGAA